MAKYAIGADFGTLSARAVVAEIGTGRELAAASMAYPHAVMDERLPSGRPLPPDWALQHPRDYLDCLAYAVPKALREAGVRAEDVVGLGIDFTACTPLPVKKDGTPLCLLPEYADRPHAYVKLWKHHAAQAEANRLNEIAAERGEAFLPRYGGKISSEWLFPKLMQILNEDPVIYDAADRFVEAGDWVIQRLTGSEARSSCLAGYKALWHKRDGYPSEAFFAALDPRLRRVVDDKLGGSGAVRSIGERAGGLTSEAAATLGLMPGTAVAVCNVDAHVSLPPAGITESDRLLMIMGTSTCHIVLSDRERIVPGMCGAVEDGVVPGLFGYEAGQSCVGDHFDWFAENLLPEAYAAEARDRGLSPHALLAGKASRLKPGEGGLIALDWWNGNRSILADADLTGAIFGMTLATRPEDVYRALVEATAYGTRTIVEAFERGGVAIREIRACGGIAQKDPFLMQIYADVLGRGLKIARSAQAPALGSAMFGAVAAGAARGGYDGIGTAAREMGGILDAAYAPDAAAKATYDRLYAEYSILHDAFGRGDMTGPIKRLKALRNSARGDAV